MSFGTLSGNVRGITILTATLDLGSVAANTTEEEDGTITGVEVGDVVVAVKPTLEAGLAIGGVRVDAADSVKITVINPTAGAIDEASETVTFLVFKNGNPNTTVSKVIK